MVYVWCAGACDAAEMIRKEVPNQKSIALLFDTADFLQQGQAEESDRCERSGELGNMDQPRATNGKMDERHEVFTQQRAGSDEE